MKLNFLKKKGTQGPIVQRVAALHHQNDGNFYLPEIPHVHKGIRKGRSVYDGYQRGWGLQFGGMREKVLNDPLYKEAFSVAMARTIQSEENRMNIFLLIRFYLERIPFGHIIEYGSYRGGSAIFMAYLAQKLYPGMKVFALDSFEGMPKTDKDVDVHNVGDFADVDFIEIQDHVAKLKLTNSNSLSS